jgi:membrane associated rhomboid family serine protease
MTKWVSTLIGMNVIVFVLQLARPELTDVLSLVPATVATHPWTPITYMFAHGGGAHIFWNMFMLYIFGPRLEGLLGGNRFITLYLLSGLGGAALSFLPAYYNAQILGASGAILGVEAAYARLWPRDRIYIWGVVPVQVWFMLAATGIYSIIGGTGVIGQGTAHFAHLGGLLVGYFYMGALARNSASKKFQRSASTLVQGGTESDAMRRWSAIPIASLHELNRGEVLRLLEKVRTQGARSLTLEERATLDRFSPT